MIPEEKLRILELLGEGLDNGTSADAGGIMHAPVTDYTCPDMLAQEQQVFFKETPLLLGMSVDLPEPGSYMTTNETGVPILMTRDGDGVFHAFFNVCRHRGVQVVPEGRGKQDRFSCPFHAWTYKNSGELLAITREQSFGCIDKSKQGLVELPAEEKYGMLWVLPTPGKTFDVDDVLGGLGPEMDSWAFNDIEYSEHQVLKADINWKLAIDTFGENYHFNILHKNTLANDIVGNLQTHDIYDRNYRMVFASKHGFQNLRDQPKEAWQYHYRWSVLNVYFLYPNTIFLIDPVGVDLLRMYPDENNPGKSRTHHSAYYGREQLDYLKDAAEKSGNNEPMKSKFVDFNKVIVDEDYMAAASTQISAKSGAQTHFTFGRNEPALHHYHNTHRLGLGLEPLPLEDA